MINVIDTEIEGVKIIEPKLFGDARGYFFESFSQREFEEKVCKTVFVQDNESQSVAGVVRGLHFQKPPFMWLVFFQLRIIVNSLCLVVLHTDLPC